MNNLDKYFRTQAQLDRQFRKLTSNPIADFIAQQQALYDNFGTSATSAIAFQQNLDKKFTLYANTLPAGFKYPENPLHDLVNSYYKIYGAASAPLTGALGIQNITPIGVQLSSGFEPLVAALDSIRIASTYVEMPAELIPDDFNYGTAEEITPSTQRLDIIKVSSKAAKYLIKNVLIPVLISYIVASLPSRPSEWEKQYHQEEMDNDSKLIQQNETIIQQNETIIQQNQESLELQQKQYEACLKGIEILEAIYNQLDSDSETLPDSDTIPPEVDFLLPQADSSPHYDESHTPDDHSGDHQAESHPHPAESRSSTTSDSLGGSESPSESD